MEVKEVTILYYEIDSLVLKHRVILIEHNRSGRVIIPERLKENFSIIAVIDGDVKVLNTLGQRIIPPIVGYLS